MARTWLNETLRTTPLAGAAPVVGDDAGADGAVVGVVAGRRRGVESRPIEIGPVLRRRELELGRGLAAFGQRRGFLVHVRSVRDDRVNMALIATLAQRVSLA